MKSSELSRRLKEARENAGYKSASDAARKMGMNVVTYTAHENGGRKFDRDDAIFYAQNFGVTPGWLMFGDVPETKCDKSSKGRSSIVNPQGETMAVVSPQSWMRQPNKIADDLEEYWEMPDEFLERRLRIRPQRARIMEVQGDSMYDPENPSAFGSLFPGERVIIDTDDTKPTPPGAFAIHDGTGIVVKLVEVIPDSAPITLRLTGRNPRYATYERPAEAVNIVGRVKAKVELF